MMSFSKQMLLIALLLSNPTFANPNKESYANHTLEITGINLNKDLIKKISSITSNIKTLDQKIELAKNIFPDVHFIVVKSKKSTTQVWKDARVSQEAADYYEYYFEGIPSVNGEVILPGQKIPNFEDRPLQDKWLLLIRENASHATFMHELMHVVATKSDNQQLQTKRLKDYQSRNFRSIEQTVIGQIEEASRIKREKQLLNYYEMTNPEHAKIVREYDSSTIFDVDLAVQYYRVTSNVLIVWLGEEVDINKYLLAHSDQFKFNQKDKDWLKNFLVKKEFKLNFSLSPILGTLEFISSQCECENDSLDQLKKDLTKL